MCLYRYTYIHVYSKSPHLPAQPFFVKQMLKFFHKMSAVCCSHFFQVTELIPPRFPDHGKINLAWSLPGLLLGRGAGRLVTEGAFDFPFWGGLFCRGLVTYGHHRDIIPLEPLSNFGTMDPHCRVLSESSLICRRSVHAPYRERVLRLSALSGMWHIQPPSQERSCDFPHTAVGLLFF